MHKQSTFYCYNLQLWNYGASASSTNMISSYLNNRKQRNKINERLCERSNMVHVVIQDSILVPLLCNNSLIDLFQECEKVILLVALMTQLLCNLLIVIDTQTYISELRIILSKFFNWFKYNHVKTKGSQLTKWAFFSIRH